MLAAAGAAISGPGSPSAPSWTLYGPAPQPEPLRVDMPVIGARTLELAAQAGLAGVAGVEDRLILIDRAAIVEAADRLGLFVWGEPRR